MFAEDLTKLNESPEALTQSLIRTQSPSICLHSVFFTSALTQGTGADSRLPPGHCLSQDLMAVRAVLWPSTALPALAVQTLVSSHCWECTLCSVPSGSFVLVLPCLRSTCMDRLLPSCAPSSAHAPCREALPDTRVKLPSPAPTHHLLYFLQSTDHSQD